MSGTGLKHTLRDFIENGVGEFGDLALRLWAHQMLENADYADICGDFKPRDWTELPAVPVALFRHLALTSFPPDEASVVFRTSGTTGARGVVRLRSTELYDLGARAHAEAVVGPIPGWGVSLVPHAVDSSLGHMCAAFCPDMVRCFSATGTDVAGAWAVLAERAATGRPLFVPGTAFALATLVAERDTPVVLPLGSVVMVTGGFKGRLVSLSAEGLRDRLRTLLPGARHVEEYGMSELGSQLWAPAHGAPFVPPPWLRVRAVDPLTGAPVRVGLLRFTDLTNMDTAVCVETRDLGEVLDDGRVVLHGRLPGAAARGCSLSVEEATQDRSAFGGLLEPVDDRPTKQRAREPVLETLQSGDQQRISAVLRALAHLRTLDPQPLSEGLSGPTALAGWTAALDALTAEGLDAELRTPGKRPGTVVVVAARGVFTAPLEWLALALAAGCTVHVKAPSGAGAALEAMVAAFQAEGLPAFVRTGHDLGEPDAVIAFGGDAAMQAIAMSTPRARHALYGHRFSLAVVAGQPSKEVAAALAHDVAMYDSRGCMAPAAVLVAGDPAAWGPVLAAALAEAEAALPRGPLDPSAGPEWRRRMGLARARGGVWSAGSAAVVSVPKDEFTPVALPGMVVMHAVADGVDVCRMLSPWRLHLSSLALPRGFSTESAGWADLTRWFPRVCALGQLQHPVFPRKHDGRPMLGSIVEPTG